MEGENPEESNAPLSEERYQAFLAELEPSYTPPPSPTSSEAEARRCNEYHAIDTSPSTPTLFEIGNSGWEDPYPSSSSPIPVVERVHPDDFIIPTSHPLYERYAEYPEFYTGYIPPGTWIIGPGEEIISEFLETLEETDPEEYAVVNFPSLAFPVLIPIREMQYYWFVYPLPPSYE